MKEKVTAVKAAFPHTLPVMAGYLFLGMAFGILLNSKGFGPVWACLMSLVIYAGSMQFLAVGLLAAGFAPVYAFLLALIVNARHLFYGLSMLKPFADVKKAYKPYLIFSLTDETFSILCSTKAPEGVDSSDFMLAVAVLDQIYFVAGSTLGGLAGQLITFNTTGIDFAMTALFTVIFLGQWQSQKRHLPALIGVAVSVVCLVVFGGGQFIIPAMGLILVALTLLRPRWEEGAAVSE